ncbi:helix-turn-helix transcriptional regulator [Delftia sp. JD2]|uniref:helix-turn-helix domain-containing protein n=1 Tax=Delftia sp. JD2 TaxID=469553 RepID=UPI000806EEAA|nr:helix-turn-helix transcriptional regulator [Delftia sp. JD2]OBY87049.1 XRE family transcriptional regulator [Delftia sp. JD2]
MRSLQEFAETMREAKKARRLTVNELANRTGLSAQSVRHVLEGATAPRLTNAMALAQELGFELMLVPSEAAQSLVQRQRAGRTVVSDVERLIPGNAPGPNPKVRGN